MPPNSDAKQALDTIIRKSRVYLYKPIQIAEILYHHRVETGWNLEDLESYRNVSKKWRDKVSIRLVGTKCTSSQKFQDNVFEANAMPPSLLDELGKLNKQSDGFIEAYIYKSFEARLQTVYEVESYIKSSTADSFSLESLVSRFEEKAGLRRSIDKMYEILVYALFATIIRALQVQITLQIQNTDKEIIKDFAKFISMVLGMDEKQTQIVIPAKLYRAGVANAADSGLDMWANFGIAIQVKHLTLTPDLVEDIADDITADKIVIVCRDVEGETIENLFKQVGWGIRIQGIVTISDLNNWYSLCLSGKYADNLGSNLLKDLATEFNAEFPSSSQIVPFMKERGYDKIKPPDGLEII